MERLNPDCTVLANLSGGVDSVYGIWKLLQAGVKPLIHHCHLGGNLRLPWESLATRNALQWYHHAGLGNFDYIESTVELPPYRYRSRMRDPELIMMISGQILRDRPHIRQLDYYNNAEDTSTIYPRVKRKREQILKFWAHRGNIRVSRPLMCMSKAAIVRQMPEELLNLCSWCRFPNQHGIPCRRCIPCRKIFAAMESGNAIQESSPETLHVREASEDG